jgi:hypothetical protein
VSLQLHRPDDRGVLKPEPGPTPDYREQLRSPRWGLALKGGRLPAMKNPEMRPTSRLVSVMFWFGLAFATFVVLILGYGIGIWSFPGG